MSGEILRLLMGLGVVLGLMWLAARMLRGTAVRQRGDALTVLGRAQLSRGASVAVVQVAGKAIVLGVTEQQVSILTEVVLVDGLVDGRVDGLVGLEKAAPKRRALTVVPAPAAVEGPATGSVPIDLTDDLTADLAAQLTARLDEGLEEGLDGQPTQSALAGSVLSPQTWRQAVGVLRERTVRRA